MTMGTVFSDNINRFNAAILQSYIPGQFDSVISAAASERERNMLTGNMYGLRMEFSKAQEFLQKAYVQDDSLQEAFTLMLMLTIDSVSGDYEEFDKALVRLKNMADLGTGDSDVNRFAELVITQAGNTIYMPKLSCDVLDNCLNGGMNNLNIPIKLYIMHIHHRRLFLLREFSKLIEATDFFYTLFPRPAYPIISGVYSIMRACSFGVLGDEQAAKENMMSAVELFKLDGFMYSFAEFQMLFDNDLMNVIRKEWPECAEMLDQNWDSLYYNRIRVHNSSNGKSMQTRLSKQELKTACFASCGLSNKEIAARLDISSGTVKTFLNNIFNKLDINDRRQIAMHLYQPIER